MRQIQRILIDRDPTATDADSLRGKSVAVQGVLALEYVLFGDGSNELTNIERPFRCSYAAAIASAISNHAQQLHDGWHGPGGFADIMKAAGEDGGVFRSHGEAVQELLQAASEQVEIVQNLKLGRVIGETNASWRPRRAPFYRSNLVLVNLRGNVEAVSNLIVNDAMAQLLPAASSRISDALQFELNQVARAILVLEQADQPWLDLLAADDNKARLRYLLQPLNGAQAVLSEGFPAALGLTMGFNSLDGD